MSKNNIPRLTDIIEVESREYINDLLSLDEETKDPNMHYRWVKDDKQRIARHRMKGYKVVTTSDQVKTIVDPDPSEDGVLRVGDTILMQCSKEKFDRRAESNRTLGERKLRAPREKMKDAARRKGVEILEDKE